MEKLTTGDKILFVFLLLTTCYIFKIAYTGVTEGNTVIIAVNNKEFGRFPLQNDRHIGVNGHLGTTEVEIKNGAVGIIHSPCPNKMCIKFGQIRHIGRVSVCLPNKVVITITGDEKTAVDAVTG